MTSNKVLRMVQSLTHSGLEDEILLSWLSDCENGLLTDLFLLDVKECKELTAGSDAPLVAPHPYDKLYVPYVQAQVHMAHGEVGKYNNYMELYNTYRDEYARYVLGIEDLGQRLAVEHGYLLTAYGIARTHGFLGTEEEWLRSLQGLTPELQIGTVTDAPHGGLASATISGTRERPFLNLVLPRGPQGVAGVAELPLAKAEMDAEGVYRVTGASLPYVKVGLNGKHEGKGRQMIFVPQTDSIEGAAISINGEEPVRIHVRCGADEEGLTKPIAGGQLKLGVPYTLTFCGMYWLVDSAVGSGSSEILQEFDKALREFADTDTVGLPVMFRDAEGDYGSMHIQGDPSDGKQFWIPTAKAVEQMISEKSPVKSINGQGPDKGGNVEIPIPDSFLERELEELELDVVEGYFIKAADGAVTTTTLSGSAYVKLSVKPGEKYLVSCRITGAMGIVLYGNGEFISALCEVVDNVPRKLVDWEVVIPSGCDTLGVCTRDEATDPIKVKQVRTVAVDPYKEIPDRVGSLEKAVGSLEETVDALSGTVEEVLDPLELKIVEGYYLKAAGGGVSTETNRAAYVKLLVKPGEKYLLSAKLNGQLGICVYQKDEFKSCVYAADGAVHTLVDWELVIPPDCDTLGVTTRYQDDNPITVKPVRTIAVDPYKEIPGRVESLEGAMASLEESDDDNDSRVFALEKRSGFSFRGLERSKVIFMNDDCHAVVSAVYEVMKRHGAVLSVGAIAERLENAMSNGMTQLEFLRMVEDDGGEILSHSMNGNPLYLSAADSGTGEEYYMPDEEAISMLRDSKRILEQAGFTVNGWVAPNGKYNTRMERYYRRYYRYAYRGAAGVSHPMSFGRTYLSGLGLDGAKALIDELEGKKEVVVLFSHWSADEITGFSIEDLDELLSYVEGKNVDVTTYRDCFFGYGSYGEFGDGVTEARVTEMISEAVGGIENGAY